MARLRRDAFLDHLAEVPLFSALSKKDLQLVARRAEDVKVDAGKVLVTEGSAGAEFFVTPSLKLSTIEMVKRYSKVICPASFVA